GRRVPLSGTLDRRSDSELCCCQQGSVLVGCHSFCYEGDPYTLVPLPLDPRSRRPRIEAGDWFWPPGCDRSIPSRKRRASKFGELGSRHAGNRALRSCDGSGGDGLPAPLRGRRSTARIRIHGYVQAAGTKVVNAVVRLVRGTYIWLVTC